MSDSSRNPTAFESREVGQTDLVDLRVLVEDHLDGVALIVGNKVRYANRALCKMTGYTPADTANRLLSDFFQPADRDRLQERAQELKDGGPRYASEYRVLCKDGSTRLVEVRSHTVEYRGETALLSVIRDLSDRQRIERRLRESEERYRVLFEDNPSMYFIVDRAGIVLSVNKFGAEQLGYRPEELVGEQVLDVFLDEDRDEVQRQLVRCLGSEGGVDTWEFRKVHKDGGVLWVSERARAIRDSAGNPMLLVVCEDITERKRAEEALQTRESQLRMLSGLTSDCCWIRWEQPDGKSQREWVTGSFARLTGYSTEEFEVIGRDGLLHPDDLASATRFINGPPGTSEHEFRIITKSGDVRFLRERMQVEKAADGNICAYGSTRDITEKKLAEHALKASQEQLNQAQRLEALGRLAGGVAHDFNNLLMVITGYGEQLISRTEDDSQPKRYASEILKAANRAGALTRQLLAFGRKQALQPRTVLLNTLVSDMREMLNRVVPENTELSFDLDPDVGAIRIDPGQFEQVVMNLVMNARDSIPEAGNITIRTESTFAEAVRARLDPNDEGRSLVRLAVSDTGRGMDAETQKHMFEPFFTTKPPALGTGLGLAAVYGIVKQSKGFVGVSSSPGEGTTVEIYLPRSDQPIETPTWAGPNGAITGGGETLLLVEDEKMLREMISDALQSWGYTVLDAGRPSEALRICREHEGPINLMLTDVIMPEMDGSSLSDRVNEIRGKTRALFMSGYTAESLGRNGILASELPFLTKPISLDRLAGKIREVLDGS